MIQNGANSIREQIKSDVLQEVQGILLSYEERIAALEKENHMLWEENRKLSNEIADLSLSIGTSQCSNLGSRRRSFVRPNK